MVNQFYCRMCGEKIGKYSYKSAIFCSGGCRTRYCRLKAKYGEREGIESVTRERLETDNVP